MRSVKCSETLLMLCANSYEGRESEKFPRRAAEPGLYSMALNSPRHLRPNDFSGPNTSGLKPIPSGIGSSGFRGAMPSEKSRSVYSSEDGAKIIGQSEVARGLPTIKPRPTMPDQSRSSATKGEPVVLYSPFGTYDLRDNMEPVTEKRRRNMTPAQNSHAKKMRGRVCDTCKRLRKKVICNFSDMWRR